MADFAPFTTSGSRGACDSGAMLKLTLLAAVSLALMAPVSEAKIVYDKSIAGARLHMTAHQVRHVLGRPTQTHGAVWTYAPKQLEIRFSHGRVTRVTTTDPRQKTDFGVGVGSSADDLTGEGPGVACDNGICISGEFRRGAPVTVFLAPNGTITSVTVTYFRESLRG